MAEALRVEASWKKKCSTTGTTSRNPEYGKLYDQHVREYSSEFASSLLLFNEAKSLAHSLETYGLAKEFEAWGPGLRLRLGFHCWC